MQLNLKGELNVIKIIIFWCVVLALMLFTVLSYACTVQTVIIDGKFLVCTICPETNTTVCN